MARAGTGRRARILLLIAGLAGSCHPLAALASEPTFDLQGTWYVLVHDEENGVQGWEDKVWTFEPRGSRLVWTEYPVVSLRDDRGRFETLASGRRVRAPGHWMPNAAQRTEIENGPGVVARWARSKTLRGDPEHGYQSRGAANRDSASVIGYSERWEISGLRAMPRFRRVDEMSGARSVSLDGVTEYRAATPGGDRISGDFERDGARRGSFSMQRVASVRLVAGDEGEDE